MGIDAKFYLVNKGEKLTNDTIFKMGVKISVSLGSHNFWIPDYRNTEDEKFHCIVETEPENLEDHTFASGSTQLLEVSVSGRYYGKGYERGDWGFYRTLAAYLQITYPNLELYYGGDCSDDADHLTPELLNEIDTLYFNYGREHYLGGLGNGFKCSYCDIPMNNCGGGGDKSFYSCSGCGKRSIVSKELYWDLKPNQNFLSKDLDIHNMPDGLDASAHLRK